MGFNPCKESRMPRQTTGHYVPGSLAGSRYRAFVPDPLPPDPPLDFAAADLVSRKERADQALYAGKAAGRDRYVIASD